MSFLGKKNVYVCQECGHSTVTIDVDDGTTPFLTGCTKEGCKGTAQSQCYQVLEPLVPTHEWYRIRDPNDRILQHPAAKWHHNHGGLFLREKLKIVH